MQQWRGQVHDMGMVLPRRALILAKEQPSSSALYWHNPFYGSWAELDVYTSSVSC